MSSTQISWCRWAIMGKTLMSSHRTKRKILIVATILGLAATTHRANANLFQTGDMVTWNSSGTLVVISPTNTATSISLPFTPAANAESLAILGNSGVLMSTGGYGSKVYEVNQAGAVSTFITAAANTVISNIMVDSNNNVFVDGYNSAGYNFISKYTSSGVLVNTNTFLENGYNITFSGLSPNENTLYYNSNGSNMWSYNLTTGANQIMPGGAGTWAHYGMQVLTNGNIMTTETSNGVTAIDEYTSSGASVYSYSVNYNGGLTIGTNGTTFYTPSEVTSNGVNSYTETGYSLATGSSSGSTYSTSAGSNNYGIMLVGSETSITPTAYQAPVSTPEPDEFNLFFGMLVMLAAVKLTRFKKAG